MMNKFEKIEKQVEQWDKAAKFFLFFSVSSRQAYTY